MNFPSSTGRHTATLYQAIRWTAILMIGFALVFCGYYVYANIINRPTADVYVAKRGTAVSAVYGTVTISSTLTLVLTSQNSGFMHLAPGYGTTITAQGQLVKKDALMATVVDEAGQRLLTQGRTDYEAAVARLKLGPSSLGLLKSAQDQLRAYDNLPPNVVPRVQRDAARNEVARLQGAVENERLELQRLADTAGGTLKTYEDQLKRTEIRSPMDGIIVAQNYNDNAYVQASVALFSVSSRDLYVAGQVNEEDVGKLKGGMKAEMRLYAYGNTRFTATVSGVLPSPDPNSSRYTVTLNMDNPPDNLLLGLTGEMNIILGRKENALIIPARALLVDQVLVVEDGVVGQRTIQLGFKSLEFAEVTDGLRDGDQVIVADQDAFHSGERVRPVPINDAAAARASRASSGASK